MISCYIFCNDICIMTGQFNLYSLLVYTELTGCFCLKCYFLQTTVKKNVEIVEKHVAERGYRKCCTRHVTTRKGWDPYQLAVFIFVHLIMIIDGGLNLSKYLTNKNISIIPIHQMSWFGSQLHKYPPSNPNNFLCEGQ